MSNQTFSYAGIAVTAKGVTKARFGNDMVSRIKKLKDNSDVNFIELPSPMTRVEAATYLMDQEEYSDTPNKRDALTRVIFRNVPKRKKVQSVTVTSTDKADVDNG
jgi:hypothetical protein